MIPEWMTRSELLMGEEKIRKLMAANVIVVGLGGVGAIAAEMIVRAGVGQMTIVDADHIEASNRNRQIPALSSTDGLLKAETLGNRLMDINPALKLTVLNEYLRDKRTFEVLDQGGFDFALDCIDTLSPKVYYIKACIERKIPIISSMGAGGKIDPTQVRICDISETYNDLLARYVRKYLHRKFSIHKGLKVVFSPEQADKTRIVLNTDTTRKKSTIGTVSYMPAVFGCACASAAIRHLTGDSY